MRGCGCRPKRSTSPCTCSRGARCAGTWSGACARAGRCGTPGGSPANARTASPTWSTCPSAPRKAADRAVPGHWEGDLIIGKGNATAIGTLVERSSGYTMLLHLPDGYRPEQVRDALAAKIQELPEVLRRSLTWDQGAEMRDWKQVSVAADVDIYFCDPHAPWQRGTNENTNGLLRQYFPKGSDLLVHTAEDLNASPHDLNDPP